MRQRNACVLIYGKADSGRAHLALFDCARVRPNLVRAQLSTLTVLRQHDLLL